MATVNNNKKVKVIILYFTNKRKNDCDNFIKPILDSGSNTLYTDDCLITDLRVRKYLGAKSFFIIKVNPIESYDDD